MTEYYYPNEVKIVVENGKRVAYLRDNWREIREKNERKTSLSPAEMRDAKMPWSFWKPPNYYWGA
jgi:hypothetical protein